MKSINKKPNESIDSKKVKLLKKKILALIAESKSDTVTSKNSTRTSYKKASLVISRWIKNKD